MCPIEEHGEDIRLFRENIEVEKSPIKQIVAVLGKDYLKELCNLGTETIIIYIPQVLVNLVTAYGMVYLDVLYIKETKFRSLFWHLSDPPVQIYNTIEYQSKITEAANIRKYPAQVINFGL